MIPDARLDMMKTWARRDDAFSVLVPSDVRELIGEVERLRAAIRNHRVDVWGAGPVKHPEDAELYAAADDGI